ALSCIPDAVSSIIEPMSTGVRDLRSPRGRWRPEASWHRPSIFKSGRAAEVGTLLADYRADLKDARDEIQKLRTQARWDRVFSAIPLVGSPAASRQHDPADPGRDQQQRHRLRDGRHRPGAAVASVR